MQALLEGTELHPEGFLYDPSLVLYLPLHELDGSPFMSRDHYGHLCTVSGAVWTLRGRVFDGTDDIITIPDAISIQNIFDGGGTLEFVFNFTTMGTAGAGRPFDKGGGLDNGWTISQTDPSGATFTFTFSQNFSTTVGVWNWANPRPFTLGTTYHATITYDNGNVANVPVLIVNGKIVAGVAAISTPVGTRLTDAARILYIGDRAATGRGIVGLLGEIRAYKGRVSSLIEIQNLYLVTKWRYV